MNRSSRGRLCPGVFVLFFLFGNPSVVVAQETEFHGFAQFNVSLRVAETDETDPPSDFLLREERLQLELSRVSQSGNLSFATKVDVFHDAVDGKADLDVREAYLTLSSRRLDLRLGRQIITWGVGDLVFINDVFPKNWTALVAGQPLQYLKVGSDAANLNFYSSALSAQVVLVPFFEPDQLPRGERLVAFDPFPGVPRWVLEPEAAAGNTELAVRFYRYIGGLDAAVYVYRGFWRSPPGLRFDGEQATQFHPGLSTYGASVQGGFLNGVLSLEGGLYDSREDRDGVDPTVENGQARVLIGYQRAFGDNLTVGLQYSGEGMFDYGAYRDSLPRGFPARKKVRHNATARITRLLKYQTVQLSLFAWASPNEEDYYLNPEIRYSASDEMWIAMGGNVFGGAADHTFFGQFDRNDNLYLTLRYSF